MSKKIILLAEDDDSIELVTNDFLSSEGYEVRSAKNPQVFMEFNRKRGVGMS